MAGGPDFLALWPRPASFLRAGELMFTPLGVITPSTRLLPQVAITRAVRRVGVKPAHKIKTPFYELQTLCKVTGGHRSTDRCSKACRETAFSRFGCLFDLHLQCGSHSLKACSTCSVRAHTRPRQCRGMVDDGAGSFNAGCKSCSC